MSQRKLKVSSRAHLIAHKRRGIYVGYAYRILWRFAFFDFSLVAMPRTEPGTRGNCPARSICNGATKRSALPFQTSKKIRLGQMQILLLDKRTTGAVHTRLAWSIIVSLRTSMTLLMAAVRFLTTLTIWCPGPGTKILPNCSLKLYRWSSPCLAMLEWCDHTFVLRIRDDEEEDDLEYDNEFPDPIEEI